MVLVNVTSLQIDDRKSTGFPVADQKATGQLELVLLMVMVVSSREGQFNQLLRLQSFRRDHSNGVGGGVVVEQIFHLGGEAGPVADHEVRLRYAHTVCGNALPRVDVSARCDQRVHPHQIAADLSHEVREHDVAGHHFHGIGRHGVIC